MHCKSYSHFFSKKFQPICVSLDVKFNESLTNDVVSFEQLGPGDFFFIVLGFNNTSTLVGHFVLSPREKEKRDSRDSRRDEREGQGRKRNRNESEETEEIKAFPLYPYLLQG